MVEFVKGSTVNFAYNGSAYKELSVIRNGFSFPDLNPSLFYVKIMDIANPVIRNYCLERTHFPVPMLNQCKFVCLVGTHFWSSSHLADDYPIIEDHRVKVVTDRLKIVYCLFNEIIGVLNVFEKSGKSKIEIAKHYDIPKSTLSGILNKKEKIIEEFYVILY